MRRLRGTDRAVGVAPDRSVQVEPGANAPLTSFGWSSKSSSRSPVRCYKCTSPVCSCQVHGASPAQGWPRSCPRGETADAPALQAGSGQDCGCKPRRGQFMVARQADMSTWRDASMDQYRMYIDEAGVPDRPLSADDRERYLGVTGVILESRHCIEVATPSIDAVQRRLFQVDPDDPVALHRNPMVGKREHFSPLRDPLVKSVCDDMLIGCFRDLEYTVATVVIDKWLYPQHMDPPYSFALRVLIERYIFFLERCGGRGDIAIESRKGGGNTELRQEFDRAVTYGTGWTTPERVAQTIGGMGWREALRFIPKTACSAGLQLADLIAYASKREILIDNGHMPHPENPFDGKITAILRNAKYLRNGTRVNGYGKKFWPTASYVCPQPIILTAWT